MPFLAGWSKRIELSIDYTDKIGGSVTWFPVVIHLKDANGDSTSIFEEIGASSRKIAITKSDGTTELKGEIECWDYDAGTVANSTATIHTSATGWTIDENTSIYIYYDSAHADNDNIGTTPGSSPASDVWDSNYEAVYHMAQDPTPDGAQMKDSTANGHDGTSQGTMASNDLVDAKVGKGLHFDNVNDYIQLPDIPTLGTYTVDVWVNFDTIGGSLLGVFAIIANNACQMREGGNNNLYFYHRTSGGSWPQIHTVISATTDYYAAIKWDGTTVTGYLNDSWTSTVAANSVGPYAPNDDVIGDVSDAPPKYEMDGVISEVKISDEPRSDAWLEGDYNSGNDSLLTYGSEEELSSSSSSSSGSSFSSSSSKSSSSSSESSSFSSSSSSSSYSSSSSSSSLSSSSSSSSLSSSSSSSSLSSSSSSSSYSSSSSSSSGGTNIKINISDSWKDVNSIKVNISNTWKDVTSIKQNVAGVWKDVF